MGLIILLFLGRNFWTQNISKPSKVLKDSGFSLVSNKNLSSKKNVVLACFQLIKNFGVGFSHPVIVRKAEFIVILTSFIFLLIDHAGEQYSEKGYKRARLRPPPPRAGQPV